MGSVFHRRFNIVTGSLVMTHLLPEHDVAVWHGNLYVIFGLSWAIRYSVLN